ncbi:hypothetical protein COO60DRAFT_1463571 [Scenedesmus sp. NREL 46B-D3]|nr:hypothetical protein COO60DRAFT_1463571 [Scenedesmus sp. NREL 46B-D3]
MGEMPHHYFPQVQVCMEICDLDHCWFVEYKPSCVTWPKAAVVNAVKVARDRQWFANNMPAMFSCWQEIKQAKEDPDAFWASRRTKPKSKRPAAARRKTTTPERKAVAERCPIDDQLYHHSLAPGQVDEGDETTAAGSPFCPTELTQDAGNNVPAPGQVDEGDETTAAGSPFCPTELTQDAGNNVPAPGQVDEGDATRC